MQVPEYAAGPEKDFPEPAEGFGGVVDALQDWAADEIDVHDAAGIIFKAPDGKVLFLRRDSQANNGGQWDWPGGHLQAGETLIDGAIREAHEETGHKAPKDQLVPVSRKITNDVDFSTFICPVAAKFEPDIGRDEDGHREHDDWRWADPRDPPKPLHEGVAEVLGNKLVDEIAEAAPTGEAQTLTSEPVVTAEDAALIDATWARITAALEEPLFLAIDEASVRQFDSEGRLKVALTPISKANVCPYLGEEIPDWERDGLNPKKIYQLLRAPEELEKAAESFNLIPVLAKHTPATAAKHPTEHTIGSTGTDAVFQHPYLMNSMAIWPDAAIDDIESELKRELSSSYRYRVDWTPGEFDGKRYDGVMRDIIGNHVATVPSGRAGSDVGVADGLNEEVQWALVEEALRGLIAA
jgi:8-oxo-dGTP pyrophosphatase MutT (NUDIX family)